MPITVHKKQLVKPAPAPAPAPVKGPLPNVKAVQPQATITKEYPDGTSTETKEDVGDAIASSAPMANVGLSMGMTIPIAQYQNIKFSVSLFVPCTVDAEDINATYEQVKAWVDERTEEIHSEISGQLEGGPEVVGAEGPLEQA
jgi:hypothetical protein